MMSSQQNMMVCPLCGYKTDIEYAILLLNISAVWLSLYRVTSLTLSKHMEESHAEGNSPFVVDADLGPDTSRAREIPPSEPVLSSDEDAGLFVECPIEGCLEQISLAELEDHVDLHAIEENEESASDGGVAIANATPIAAQGRGYQSPYSSPEDVARSNREYEHERARAPVNHEGAIDAWKKLFGRRPAGKTVDWESKSADGKTTRKRLGVSELGKHAYEQQMPESLVALLRKRKYTSAEGGFCGYRNIQMLSSYIVGAHAEGTDALSGRIPSIFRIQDYIENAWDMGINANGRIETGGVKGTRKYIGTPEAQAMFISLKIPCEAEGFKSSKDGAAEAALFASVQNYFEKASFSPGDKVRCTNLPPIYFQHRGHSLTIVGLEKRASGSLKLLVFDPMFHDPDGVIRLVERTSHRSSVKEDRKIRNLIHRNPDSALRLYRRGNNYLKKYHEFEILRLKMDPA
ncbi:hypothetical protein EKO27_g3963 [Xylaria grammica]|uniref:UFSP1/2/DUB catalytic domain-containing protein n=1 Tax=Xylaria grammica TaxID=363999 RepID=A0A439D9R1_9PEZI|nr:hypothetical protein EKO27_g3963 [Xylaria grammica]